MFSIYIFPTRLIPAADAGTSSIFSLRTASVTPSPSTTPTRPSLAAREEILPVMRDMYVLVKVPILLENVRVYVCVCVCVCACVRVCARVHAVSCSCGMYSASLVSNQGIQSVWMQITCFCG